MAVNKEMHRISCFTLFDITRTGVPNRAKPYDESLEYKDWYNKRSTQCNFDTILQIISLRAQPDVINDPKKIVIDISNSDFGLSYKECKQSSVWTFDFEVNHSSVFEDGINELGHLYMDCDQVPMILTDNLDIKLLNTLRIDNYFRNIIFKKI